MSSGSPPLLPSNGSAGLDRMTSLEPTLPCTRKSAVFIAPLEPPDGSPAASIKLPMLLGFSGVHENPWARASPPKAL